MPLQRSALIALFLATCVMNAPHTDQRLLHVRTETARLRQHFDTVNHELRARDASTLNAQQRAARLTLINWLRDYRDAGVFPQNGRFPAATPFFRDDRGTLCAMAYLIARSGRNDIVDRIAQTRNNAYIRELTDDTALVGWLDDAGLTADEAARIQPSYPCGIGNICTPPQSKPVNHDYAVASVATGIASLTTAGLSLSRPSKPRGWAAVIAGSVEIVLGATHFNVGRNTSKVAAANVIAGGIAVAAGIRALSKAAHGGSMNPPRSGKTIDLALMSPFNALTQESQRGLLMRITF